MKSSNRNRDVTSLSLEATDWRTTDVTPLFFEERKCILDPLIGPYQELILQTRVDLGAMAMKEYFAFPKATSLLKPHHQIVKSYKQDIRWVGVSPLCRDAVSAFFSPSRLGLSGACKNRIEWQVTYSTLKKWWAININIIWTTDEVKDFINLEISAVKEAIWTQALQ